VQAGVAQPQEAPGKVEAIREEQLRGLRVLIVDDNATNRRILQETVIRWGMEAQAVDSAASAIAALRAHGGNSFQLLLVDEKMPEMDGFELIEYIQKNFKVPGAIMMLGSTDQPVSAGKCRSLGVNSYVVKPVKAQELLLAIRSAMRMIELPAKPAVTEIKAQTQKRRILLAEDNVINQTLVVRLLQKMGHEVVVAGNGAHALERWEQEPFDLIFMDVQMSEMDGFEATREIRRREEKTGKHIPIIAMTAHATAGYQQLCWQSGMDHYIAKPVSGKALAAALELAADLSLAPGSGEAADAPIHQA
jgi:CheY-like chemotaxis protein